MAGHIPILRTGGDNIVSAGAALTQPGLEAAASRHSRRAERTPQPVPRRPFAPWTPPGPTSLNRAPEPWRPSQKGPDMAAPTATAALNASVFAPGDQMLLTVTYSDADTKPLTVTIVVTDAQGNSSAPVKVTAVIDPLTVIVTDNSGRTWTRVSDNGSVAVYRSVA